VITQGYQNEEEHKVETTVTMAITTMTITKMTTTMKKSS